VEPDPPQGGPVGGAAAPAAVPPGVEAALSSANELAQRQREMPAAGAVWDIWSAEDEPKLSAFLWRIASEESGDERVKKLIGHPIHDANVYVTAAMRRRLWEEEGVLSYRFLQHEGEAVFIPAGCPHQVYNIRSSIKAAEDFVSPEHIERCLTLTEQFRQLPVTHRRKQDGLGVKDIMLHAVAHAISVLGEGEDEDEDQDHGGVGASFDGF
jgi:lysine-specific demethylase 3